MPSAGRHLVLEMYDCPADLLNDVRFVERALTRATAESGCTLIKHLVHKFDPQGVTGLALLAESHISIHTWPEANYAAADVFTCGHKAIPERACEFLVGMFRAGQHSLKKLERGELVASQKPGLFAEYPQPNLEPQVETAVS